MFCSRTVVSPSKKRVQGLFGLGTEIGGEEAVEVPRCLLAGAGEPGMPMALRMMSSV
jgi:hypothetical protein